MDMDRESRYIYYLKAAAIYCVVCAHVALIPSDFCSANQLVSKILECMGTMGVPIFYILAGYFYEKNTDSIKLFWSKKWKSIIIPWIFCGTVLWLYVVLRKGGISFSAWVKFLVGVNYSTYYLTCLIFFFVVLWVFRRCPKAVIACTVVSFTGLLLTGMGNPWMKRISNLMYTEYLNPIHWLGYFCIGILISIYTSMHAVGKWCRKYIGIAGMLLVLTIACHIRFRINYTYFSRFALVNTAIATVFIFGILYMLKDKEVKILYMLGQDSFSIYLLHQLTAGVVVRVTSKIDLFVLTWIRPCIVLAVTMAGIQMIRYMKLNLFCDLIGIRKRRN